MAKIDDVDWYYQNESSYKDDLEEFIADNLYQCEGCKGYFEHKSDLIPYRDSRSETHNVCSECVGK